MDFNIATALHLATKLSGEIIVNQEEFLLSMNNYLKEFEEILNNSLNNSEFSKKNDPNNDILTKKLTNIDTSSFLKQKYVSASKIVLSGLGSDEIFGGYSRYKSSFMANGENGLQDEMSKDINRIWLRNFGRDDRVCSDNGIEMRFPFFDHELINFISNVRLELICDFENGRGKGEKLILRNLMKMNGFKLSYQFEKRAIQFGTKLAKFTNINTYGSNRKANGKAQFN